MADDDIQNLRVTAMSRASYLSDGSRVELEFKGESGVKVVLDFDPDELEAWAAQAVSLTRQARSQRQSTAGHREVHVEEAVAAAASAPVGGGKVILSLRGRNGIAQHFGLTIDEAAGLRPQLRKAEQEARAQAGQTRQ